MNNVHPDAQTSESSLQQLDKQALDKKTLDAVIRRIVDTYPRRPPTSDEERLAQQLVSEYFDELGIECELHPFTFPSTVHANFVLHFGLGTLGTLVSPLLPKVAFALHAGSAASYLADTSRRKYILRKLLSFKPSQNLLATLPSQGPPRLRIVFAAHIDAAFTGWVFDPRVVRLLARDRKLPFNIMKQPIRTAVRAQVALAAIDALRALAGPVTLVLRPVEWVLTIPSALTFLLNAQILLNNKLVQGANDDLSGVAAMVLLAQRFAVSKPDNVEIVFAVTGCEEAGLGGADALATKNPLNWQKNNTVVVALDTISSGKLCYLDPEGETVPLHVPPWVRECLEKVVASDTRFSEVRAKVPPVGGTDAAAFLAHGWDAVALTRIDPELGSARNYHRLTDTPDNIDLQDVLDATDFAELLARAMIDARASGP